MNFIKLIIIFFLSLTCLETEAQRPKRKKIIITKTAEIFSGYYMDGRFEGIDNSVLDNGFGVVGLNFNRQKLNIRKGFSLEFKWNNLLIPINILTGQTTKRSIQVNYNIAKLLDITSKIKFYYGGFTALRFYSANWDPIEQYFWDIGIRIYGLNFGALSDLRIILSKKTFLNLGVRLEILSIDQEVLYQLNPTLSKKNQLQSALDFDFVGGSRNLFLIGMGRYL